MIHYVLIPKPEFKSDRKDLDKKLEGILDNLASQFLLDKFGYGSSVYGIQISGTVFKSSDFENQALEIPCLPPVLFWNKPWEASSPLAMKWNSSNLYA